MRVDRSAHVLKLCPQCGFHLLSTDLFVRPPVKTTALRSSSLPLAGAPMRRLLRRAAALWGPALAAQWAQCSSSCKLRTPRACSTKWPRQTEGVLSPIRPPVPATPRSHTAHCTVSSLRRRFVFCPALLPPVLRGVLPYSLSEIDGSINLNSPVFAHPRAARGRGPGGAADAAAAGAPGIRVVFSNDPIAAGPGGLGGPFGVPFGSPFGGPFGGLFGMGGMGGMGGGGPGGMGAEGMSYEQLLALQERLGGVSRGATQEQIGALPLRATEHVSRSALRRCWPHLAYSRSFEPLLMGYEQRVECSSGQTENTNASSPLFIHSQCPHCDLSLSRRLSTNQGLPRI